MKKCVLISAAVLVAVFTLMGIVSLMEGFRSDAFSREDAPPPEDQRTIELRVRCATLYSTPVSQMSPKDAKDWDLCKMTGFQKMIDDARR